MAESFTPPQSQVEHYFGLLESRLANVPELRPALDLAIANPVEAWSTYGTYVSLVDRMSRLTEHEKTKIQIAKAVLSSHDGSVGSASTTSAAELDEAVGDEGLLTEIASHSIDPSSPYFIVALEELTGRLEGGHQLSLRGAAFADGDQASNEVIWGHTQLIDPTALMHFTICHFLERYFAKELAARGVALASQKDFFLNALTDVVIIDHLSTNDFRPVFELWAKPKAQGGLGWIVPDRLSSYATH